MGLSKVRFKAEVDFDGRVVTRSYLEKQDIEQILNVCELIKSISHDLSAVGTVSILFCKCMVVVVLKS